MKTTKLIAIFLAVFAITSFADSAMELQQTLSSYGLGSSVNGNTNTITVNGGKTGATSTLTLNISSDATVIWKAQLTGTMTLSTTGLINISGTGTFEMQSGGTVENTANDVNAITIYNNSSGTMNIKGGTVTASNSGTAIYNNSSGAVNISSGTVAGGAAIYNKSSGDVNISGGTVKTTSNYNYAIYNDDTGKITISGNAIVTGASGTSGQNYATIYIGSSCRQPNECLVITGGTVENTATSTSAKTIDNLSSGLTIISGGTVSAASGTAIHNNFNGTVIVNGGTVTSATGNKYVNLNNGTIIAWDNPAGSKTYTAFASNDIIKHPSTITAEWKNKDGADAGIQYTNGEKTDFVVVRGVTVNKITPAVTWPTSATINYGQYIVYAVFAGQSGAGTFSYTIFERPTVAESGKKYQVTFAPTDLYNYDTLKHDVAITVNKAKRNKPTVTNTSLVYNSNEQSAGIATNAAYTITNGSAKNAGNYNATVALNDKANYEWADNTDTDILLPWKIERATGLENDAPPVLKISYSNTNPHTYSLSTIALNKLDHGTLSYEPGDYNPGDNILASPPALNRETLLLSYQGVGKTSGNATQKIIVTSQNYADINVTITFQAIDKAEVDIIGITAQNSVYDGTPKSGYTGTATSGAYTGALLYEYAGTNHPQSTTPPKNVGEYTIKISVPPDAPYIGVWSDEFTITKATAATPTGITATAGQTLADIASLLPAGWAWATPTASVGAVGTQTHKANYTPTDTDNYNALTDIDVSIEVKPAETPIFSNRGNPRIGQIGVQTTSNSILLENLPSNAKVEVYNLQGILIFSSGKSVNRVNRGSDNLQIQVQTKGMYIIKVSNQTLRIAVK